MTTLYADLKEHGHQIDVVNENFVCRTCLLCTPKNSTKSVYRNCPESSVAYRRWVKRLNEDTISKSYIGALSSLLGWRRDRLQNFEAEVLERKTKFGEIGMFIEKKHSEQGLAWLKKNKKHLNEFQLKVLENFTHFTFDGFEKQWSGHRYVFALVYTVHSAHESFSYIPYPWQSGTGILFQVIKEVKL